MGNIKDINLINKELGQAQKDIEELKGKLLVVAASGEKETS